MDLSQSTLSSTQLQCVVFLHNYVALRYGGGIKIEGNLELPGVRKVTMFMYTESVQMNNWKGTQKVDAAQTTLRVWILRPGS